MGRHAEGWKLHWVRGIAYVRFTYEGTRFDISTRQRDPEAASRKALEIYKSETSGVRTTRQRVSSNLDFEAAVAMWLAELEGGLDALTVQAYSGMAARWVSQFETIHDLAHAGKLTTYAFNRLKLSLRKTLQSELSAIHGFLQWAKRNSLIGLVPPMPKIPLKMLGTRTGPQREKPVELSREQIKALIDAIPVWSLPRGPDREPVAPEAVARLRELAATGATYREVALVLTEEGYVRPRGGPWHHQQVRRILEPKPPQARYPVKPYFEFAYETSLRPETLKSIRVPRNWTSGSAYLEIEDAIDKARFGRRLPLNARAREILEEWAPKTGFIFGRHHYFRYLKKAAATLGYSLDIAPYDFRHARATHLLEDTGNLPGVAFMLGHLRMTTTNRYAKATQRAAESAIWGSDSGVGPTNILKKATGSR